MARGVAYVVFVLPAIFTVVFGSAVLASALDSLDRELNMWPTASHDSTPSVEMLGLQEEYMQGDIVELQMYMGNTSFDCGDVNVIVYNSAGDVIFETLYPSQCILADSQLLVLDGLLTDDLEPGSYTITTIIDIHGNQLIGSTVFYIR